MGKSSDLSNINSINTYKSSILNFVRPRENLVFENSALNGSLNNSSEEKLLNFTFNLTLWSRRLPFPVEFCNFKVHNKFY